MPTPPETPIKAVDSLILPLSPAAIWPVLADIGRYPQWWPRLFRLRVLQATSELIGSELEIRPIGSRAFRCRVTSREEPMRIGLRYGGGFIEGTAEWRLEEVGQGTRVSYVLDVTAHGRMMALLGKWIDLGRLHSRSMRFILGGLQTELFRR